MAVVPQRGAVPYARIGGGTALGVAYRELAPYGLTIPGGTCPTVSVGGLAQGGGLGRALMASAEDQARRAGLHSMIAGVAGENAGGAAFHAAIGYATIARLPQVGWKFGRWHDLVLMQKML